MCHAFLKATETGVQSTANIFTVRPIAGINSHIRLIDIAGAVQCYEEWLGFMNLICGKQKLKVERNRVKYVHLMIRRCIYTRM